MSADVLTCDRSSGACRRLHLFRQRVSTKKTRPRFTGFTKSADAEDVMALLRDYHAAIGEIIINYNGTLERYAGDGVMVVFNDPVPVANPALQAVLMALEMRDAIGALTEKWRRLGHDIGFGIGIAHGFATLGTIGFEGRFDYAAIGTVSNVASRLCDEAQPGQILISPRVLMKFEDAVKVEPVGEFVLKGIRRRTMWLGQSDLRAKPVPTALLSCRRREREASPRADWSPPARPPLRTGLCLCEEAFTAVGRPGTVGQSAFQQRKEEPIADGRAPHALVRLPPWPPYGPDNCAIPDRQNSVWHRPQ
jgi:class 3 adenylate cyclase